MTFKPVRESILTVSRVAWAMPLKQSSKQTDKRGRRGNMLLGYRKRRMFQGVLRRLRPWLGSQDLVHRLTLGQFIDEFVEVTNLSHCWLLNFFDANAADHAFDR